MEYNRAVELKKPRLIFFSHDDHPFTAKDFETGAGAEKLKALKERIGRARVAAFFKSSADLRAHAGSALANLANELDKKPDPQAETMARAIVAEMQRQGLVAKAVEAGVTERAVLELARRLKPNEELSLEQAVKEVSAAVETAIDVISKGERGGNLGDLVNAVLARIAEKTETGDIEGAAREADRGFAEWERAEAERRETSVRSGIALLEAGLEQDILRRDAPAAARRVEKIVALEHPDDASARFAALRERQGTFYVHGSDQGINFALVVAIQIGRLTLASARGSEEHGKALIDLGIALSTLGERESGTAKLEEAVAAFREALKESTCQRGARDLAMAQGNLGETLSRLGERESGTARLDEAVAALREALKEWTRERVPLEWARTQNNLGGALLRLGVRESGTAKLEAAVAAYREALKECPRECVPLDWARTQNNLGNALFYLGERERGTAKLEEAVAAYREVLKEWTRERVPLYWASTQNNLGGALLRLGERDSGTDKLEEAVTAYREALKEKTRERVPLDWATTQNNLGSALMRLGERESGTAKLEEAVAAYRAATQEWTRERVPLDWAGSIGNEGVTLMLLAERRGDAAIAETALSRINAAFETMRDGGHAPSAASYERLLPRARALVARLRGR
jgi:tetratricopeptide (TPR) repeat protein